MLATNRSKPSAPLTVARRLGWPPRQLTRNTPPGFKRTPRTPQTATNPCKAQQSSAQPPSYKQNRYGFSTYPYVGNMPMDAVDPMGERRVAFCYTGKGSQVFFRACQTWKNDVIKEAVANDMSPDIKLITYTTGKDFIEKWRNLHRENAQIEGLEIFGHGSPTSLYASDSKVNVSGISSLQKLNWHPAASIGIHACQTGKQPNKGKSVAEAFSAGQCVRTCGQKGYSYFSENPDSYQPIDQSGTMSNQVYLDDFIRCSNAKNMSGASCAIYSLAGQSVKAQAGSKPFDDTCYEAPLSKSLCPENEFKGD